ncbi:hypothetical protein E4100_04020 [Soehngenia longivitae]|uniref:Uncharacterized protein n=1 Tax=Soehngenia longivitae TaxID=2562294 RepID=A0A4Z0D766_9FIRM|nr:hypothetical protein [Soehngenia longivitae]TFZ40731.1 hypothetical protein E4100_04020 [Soehngenia longivitae]
MVNPLARVIMSNMTKDNLIDKSPSESIRNTDFLEAKDEKIIRDLIKGNTKQFKVNEESESVLSETITLEQLADKQVREE